MKGECKRGEECPFRHERPSDPDDPLSDQNIRDRYYGVNDPVADKIMKRASALPTLEPPQDPHITTLYIGGLDETITEQDIKNNFYQYGEIRQITMVTKQGCAFVQYTKRSSAEAAAEKSFNKLVVKGKKLTIRWGKAQGKVSTAADQLQQQQQVVVPSIPGLPAALPAPPEELSSNFFNLGGGPTTAPTPAAPAAAAPAPAAAASAYFLAPPGAAVPGMAAPQPIHYPSQDPARMGATTGPRQ